MSRKTYIAKTKKRQLIQAIFKRNAETHWAPQATMEGAKKRTRRRGENAQKERVFPCHFFHPVQLRHPSQSEEAEDAGAGEPCWLSLGGRLLRRRGPHQ